MAENRFDLLQHIDQEIADKGVFTNNHEQFERENQRGGFSLQRIDASRREIIEVEELNSRIRRMFIALNESSRSLKQLQTWLYVGEMLKQLQEWILTKVKAGGLTEVTAIWQLKEYKKGNLFVLMPSAARRSNAKKPQYQRKQLTQDLKERIGDIFLALGWQNCDFNLFQILQEKRNLMAHPSLYPQARTPSRPGRRPLAMESKKLIDTSLLTETSSRVEYKKASV